MSDLRSGGRNLSFGVLATIDSDEGFSLRSDDAPAAVLTKSNRRKRKHRKKKKKKVNDELDLDLDLNRFDSSSGFVINSNCRSSVETETVTAVVYEEAFVPSEEKRVCSVSSSVREANDLRQRSSFCSFEEAMYRVEENVKEMDDSSRAGSEFDTELMMKQTAEMNVNGHHVGRMLEKDQSMDWKQFMAEKDPTSELLLQLNFLQLIYEFLYDLDLFCYYLF